MASKASPSQLQPLLHLGLTTDTCRLGIVTVAAAVVVGSIEGHLPTGCCSLPVLPPCCAGCSSSLQQRLSRLPAGFFAALPPFFLPFLFTASGAAGAAAIVIGVDVAIVAVVVVAAGDAADSGLLVFFAQSLGLAGLGLVGGKKGLTAAFGSFGSFASGLLVLAGFESRTCDGSWMLVLVDGGCSALIF